MTNFFSQGKDESRQFLDCVSYLLQKYKWNLEKQNCFINLKVETISGSPSFFCLFSLVFDFESNSISSSIGTMFHQLKCILPLANHSKKKEKARSETMQRKVTNSPQAWDKNIGAGECNIVHFLYSRT